MKKKLKIVLLLSGIIGNTYGSNQLMSNENETPRTARHVLHQSTDRSVLREITPNMSKSDQKYADCILREALKTKIQTLTTKFASLQERAEGYDEMINSPYGKVLEQHLKLTKNYQHAITLLKRTLIDVNRYTDQLSKLEKIL